MNSTRTKPITGFLLALCLLAIVPGTALAATFDLCAGEGTVTLPDGRAVTIWGFALDTGGACTPTLPGPVLRVPSADAGLTVNLRNTLPDPVSLHILGQMLSPNNGPVWDGNVTGSRTPGDFTSRVRSFTHEAAANGGTATYIWPAFKPGTYMVQSGTNPAKQVQMGLTATVVKDFDDATFQAYDGIAYDAEVILVYTEIDPVIHDAVAAGQYGSGGTVTSSIYREPSYFLVNGAAYPDASLDPVNAAAAVNVGDRLLIRFVNAGAETHVPQILQSYFDVVAEDGAAYAYPQETYAFELNAAKTVDVIYEPAFPGKRAVLDAGLKLFNAAQPNGGMLAYLQVGGSAVGGDTVAIQDVQYDPAADTLYVVATSDQADVSLTAEGFGALDYKSWLTPPIYRTTFSGVTTRPASVLVTSSGGGSATYTFPAADAVTVTEVTYSTADNGTLYVVATSSDGGNPPTLTAEGFGPLSYKSWLASPVHRATFTNVGARPASVTVGSTNGGSATYTFPAADTVTITGATYSADSGGTLYVVATSSDGGNPPTLTAEGFGPLGYKSWLTPPIHRATFTGIGANPGSVTVTSSGGGTDTFVLP